MSQSDDLKRTVQDLIDRQTEGTYWDFKLQHHTNNADLIHDVLCLANAEHQGARFLIFGVDDNSYAVNSVSNSPGRKNQANFSDLFRANASKFFQSRTPTIYLTELQFSGQIVDVLVIEDKPHKPYYLVDEYSDKGSLVRANHVYTRFNDTNTPMQESAPPHEIERMWRERFGLDRSPIERVMRYLENSDAWVRVSEDMFGDEYFHHRAFPEFTLRIGETDNTGGVASNEEWTRGEIRKDDNAAWFYLLYYHQTLLHRTRVVTFDNGKKSMVAPDWRTRCKGRFYFYKSDSVDYALQRFHSYGKPADHSTTLRISGQGKDSDEARALWGNKIRIPVLDCYELEGFLGDEKDVDSSTDESEQYQLYLRNQIDFEKWRASQTSS